MKAFFLATMALILLDHADTAWAKDLEAAPAASPTRKSSDLKLVRVRFVPGAGPMKGEADFRGASWTALGKGPQNGVLLLQAHAGLGDTFPVDTKDGTTLFKVKLTAGDDDHVVLEIRSKEGPVEVDLPRDKRGTAKIGGTDYTFAYPSVSVGARATDKTTTDKVMLLISCPGEEK